MKHGHRQIGAEQAEEEDRKGLIREGGDQAIGDKGKR